MKNKFDCVEMKHKSAEKIREKIKVATLEEELKFWQKRSVALKSRQKAMIKNKKILA
ncbi:MAG: hypothetical protein GXO74_13660 [Calditrichaeota bacterium]|nr:hypothetical protein [Calditrichota bacterium]